MSGNISSRTSWLFDEGLWSPKGLTDLDLTDFFTKSINSDYCEKTN